MDNTWKDILLTSIGKNFTAASNEVQANEIKLSISSLDNYQGDPLVKVPRLAFDVAYEFCLQKGMRISHQNELVKLYQERGRNLYNNDGWPVTTPYWVSTNTQEALSLENLKSFNYVQEAFVTCVNKDIINIILSPLNTILKKGETVQLTAKTENETGFPGNTTQPVKWKTNNRHIATVDENGFVTGVGDAVGVASISATSDGVVSSDYARIAVYALKDVSITPKRFPEMYPKMTLQLTATPVYVNNFQPVISTPITWRSSNSTVSVDANGLITAISPGTAHIYAAVDGGENKQPFVVTVNKRASKIFGDKGVFSVSIEAKINPNLLFRAHELIIAIYSSPSIKLLAGTSGGDHYTNIFDFNDLSEISFYSAEAYGRRALSKIIWKGKNTKEYSAGKTNPNATFEGTIKITQPIKGITAYVSSQVYTSGDITGLQVDYFD